MHTDRSQGHSSRCLVKGEENLLEYKQRSLLETIVSYTFSLHAKLSYVAQRDVQNDDKRRLVRHSEVLVAFLPHESQEKMAANLM